MNLLKRFYDDYSWELKYRPIIIKDLTLPDRIKNLFNTPEKLQDVGNILLTGQRGTGKTSLALCISENSGRETIYFNMSLDNSIETIRNSVIRFITTVSMDGLKKIIIGDEFDRLSIQAMDSLKSLIEEYSKNVNFIFISNHDMKITPELKSRLTEINFSFNKNYFIEA